MSARSEYELRCRVHGRVQGVMFRDFCQRQARTHLLTGWVKNNTDGTVTLVVCGSKTSLEEYLNKLNRGSMWSQVDRIESEWGEPQEEFKDFLILYE